MIPNIILFALVVGFVIFSCYLAVALRKARDERDTWEDEADHNERENAALKIKLEAAEKENETNQRLHAEARDKHDVIVLLYQSLEESLESELRETNQFLEVALNRLSNLDDGEADDLLKHFILYTRARIRGGDEPLVHSEDPVQGLQRQSPRHGLHSVQSVRAGGLQTADAVSVDLPVAGQAEGEPGPGDAD